MNCEVIREKLTSYCLGDLSEAERADVAAHLDQCEGCRAERKEVEQTLDLLRDALAASSSVADPAVSRLTPERRARILEEGPVRRPARGLLWFTLPHPQVAVLAAACLVAAFVIGALMLPALSTARGRAKEIKYCMTTMGESLPAPACAVPEPVTEGKERPSDTTVHHRYLPRPSGAASAPSWGNLTGVPASGAPTLWGEKKEQGLVTVNGLDSSRISDDVKKETAYGTDATYKADRFEKDSKRGRMGVGGGGKLEDEVPARMEKPKKALMAKEAVEAHPNLKDFGGAIGGGEAVDGDESRSRRTTTGIAGKAGANVSLPAVATPPGQEPTPPAKPDAAIVFHIPDLSADELRKAAALETKQTMGQGGGRGGAPPREAPAASQPPPPPPPPADDAVGDGLRTVKSPVVMKGVYASRQAGAKEGGAAADKGIEARARLPAIQLNAEETPGEPVRTGTAKSDEKRWTVEGWDKIETKTASGAAGGQTAQTDNREDGRLMPERRAETRTDLYRSMDSVEALKYERLRKEKGQFDDKRMSELDPVDINLTGDSSGRRPGPEDQTDGRIASGGKVVNGKVAEKGARRETVDNAGEREETTLFGASFSVQTLRNEADRLPPKFKAFGVNPFVEAAAQPFSTFAIDVDTASYTVSRNYMLRGQRPPAEAVRTEEFVNFFDYAYAAPARETFRVYADVAPSKFGRGLHLLKIGVKGRRLGREEQRGAVLTFLVDTSGSMDKPDRIGLIRKSMKLLAERLGPQDQLAIVQFGSNARLILEHTPASEKAKIVAAIDALQCSGSTNLEEGMLRAYEAAAASFRPKSENRVLILSDGVANLGAVAAEDILGKVESFRKQGIYCSVFGFGIGTFDDTMLESLANKGNGTYAFVDSEAEATRLFVEDLAATLNTIAADVKIQVEFSPRTVARYRQIGYENRQLKKEDFRNDAIDAGEVGSGQSVTALYEMEMKPDVRGAIATVRVRYRRTDTGKVEEIERPVTAADLKPAFDQSDARFRLAACAAELAEKLRGSPHAAGSEFAGIAAALEPVALELKLDARVQELLGLARSAGSLSIAAE